MAAWLPTVLELGLAKCRTRATAADVELIELLSGHPSPTEVLDLVMPPLRGSGGRHDP